MTDDLIITGVDQLAALGARLKAAGDGSLRRELLAGLRAAAKPLVVEARQSARDRLPKAGGLNQRIASDPMSVRNRITGRDVGVRIVTTTTDTRGSNRGSWRHPVFGHTDRWAWQTYAPAKGWFDDSMTRDAPKARTEMLAAMEIVAAKITEGG